MPNPLSIVAAVDHRTIRIHNADTLIFLKNGEALDSMTPEAMLALAGAMVVQARKAMEARPAVAEQLAFDSAVLLRGGVPLGLSDDPRIQDMARKEAVSNRELRRAMPGGVQSTVQFGAPSLTQTPGRDHHG